MLVDTQAQGFSQIVQFFITIEPFWALSLSKVNYKNVLVVVATEAKHNFVSFKKKKKV